MSRARTTPLGGIAVLAALAVSGCGDRSHTELVVFAAASLADAMREIEARFTTAAPQVRVQLHLAGSSALGRQIAAGAPCDVYVSADEADIHALQRAGTATPPRTLAHNRLAVFTSPDGPDIERLEDLVRIPIGRIAIGNPRTAPVGRYTMQALEAANLAQQLEPRLVLAEHARQIVAYVATGAADVGFAYRTDTLQEARVRLRFTVSPDLHEPIAYSITRLQDGASAEAARRFIEFACGREGRSVLRRHGFGVPGDAPTFEAARPDRAPGWSPLWLSLRVALFATVLAGVAGLSLAALLANGGGPGRDLVAALADLPLVLPPTVVGLVLLELVGSRGPFGGWLQRVAGMQVAFTWGAAVLASAIMALPLMVRTARAALESVPARYTQAARTLGASRWMTFWSVRLPLARRGVAAGVLLCFFRALGEFGATLMVAGNIPGRTQTLPLAIYSAVFEGRPRDAVAWVLVVATLSLLGALSAQRLVRRTAS